MGKKRKDPSSPSSLNVEDTVVGPDVLVVTDESTARVGREGGLSSSGETEEEGDVAVGTLVCRRVEREVAKLDGLEVVLHVWIPYVSVPRLLRD